MLKAFEKSNKNKASVTQWEVYVEDHSSGGKHFYMALKLNTTCSWLPIFEYLRNDKDITVSSPSKNCVYLAAYRYTCKEKSFEFVLQNPDHPNLKYVKSSVSKKASKTLSENCWKTMSIFCKHCRKCTPKTEVPII